MIQLTEDMPLDARNMRLVLSENFRYLNQAVDFEDRKKIESLVQEYTKKATTEELKQFQEKLQKEIRAIVLPDLSPLQVTQEVLEFRTDSQGIKQTTMANRLMAEIRYLMMKYFDHSDLWKRPIQVDDAGRITTNYIQLSSLKEAKHVGILGDSVSRGYLATYNYGDIFHRETQATITNLAVNGARMTNNSATSIFQQSKKLSGCDVVILQGTDDDWLGNVPIGTKQDDEITSYIGAFYQVVNNIRTLNPNAKILVMTTTLQAPVNGTTIRRTDRMKNTLGKDLHDYMDAQKLACNDLGLPYADFMRSNLFEPLNPAFRKKMMPEGLHPNELGHQLIAQELAKNFYYFYD